MFKKKYNFHVDINSSSKNVVQTNSPLIDPYFMGNIYYIFHILVVSILYQIDYIICVNYNIKNLT